MKRSFIFLGLTMLISIGLYGQTLPEGFTDEVLNIQMQKPIGVEFAQNGIGFSWEKNGRLWTIDTLDQRSTDPILDIREEVASYGDHGLVNIALHPNFLENGYIYLIYSVDRHHLMTFGTVDYDPSFTIESQASIGRVTRYTLDIENGYKAIENTRKILVGSEVSNGLPILMISHCTGDLVFGQDNSLMISTGESASFTQADKGDANDTYHEQAIADGIMPSSHNVGSYRSMLLNSLLGKVLRIDPETGEGLASNPFYDVANPNSAKSKVWVLGFRNPYKMVKVPNTGSHNIAQGNPGKFIVGDVGGGAWEELNLVEASGKWFGWPMYEGLHNNTTYQMQQVINPEARNPKFGDNCDEEFLMFQDMYKNDYAYSTIINNPCAVEENLSDDVYTYRHMRPFVSYNNVQWNPPTRTEVPGYNEIGNPLPRSVLNPVVEMDGSELVTGGSSIPSTFNTEDQFPEEYKDQLFFVDFYGLIGTAKLGDNHELEEIKNFYNGDKGITNASFSPHNGCLYFTNITQREFHKVCYGGVLPPKQVVTIDPEYGPSPLLVNFDASQSISYAGTPLTYEWNFGDGDSGSGPVTTHTYVSNEIKKYDVELIVTDSIGTQSVRHYNVSINNTPPDVKITSVVDGSTYSINDYTILPLEAEVSDAEFSEDQLQYEWQVDFYHDEHFHLGSVDENKETFTYVDPLGCGQENYWYKINLTVTDPAGLRGTDAVEIFPYCGDAFASYQYFTGILTEEENVLLEWGMDLQEDLSHFVIERTDSYIFLNIGEVSANDPHEFVDEQPMTGRNFYRLRAVNNNGDYFYSEIVQVDILPEIPFQLFPNPATAAINLELFVPTKDDIQFELYNLQGKKIMTRNWDPNPNQVFQESISIEDLPGATYLYRVIIGDKSYGNKVMTF